MFRSAKLEQTAAAEFQTPRGTENLPAFAVIGKAI